MAQTLEVIFDGDVFRPTKPVNLKPDTKAEVVIPNRDDEWYDLSSSSLNSAFGENEPEYSVKSAKEKNPEYEGS
jgi:predicted DNA-binding antitoxin AbrB/MazE fold protein